MNAIQQQNFKGTFVEIREEGKHMLKKSSGV